ncbi:MAG: hypothetical protein TREMPRED_001089 [Tremellales sp. Tagirdzhanova-0007]|nr:MAG: hypothetical protein TREMPRED_001089 [Tremellales sp. Tagirdzhanova-0007]
MSGILSTTPNSDFISLATPPSRTDSPSLASGPSTTTINSLASIIDTYSSNVPHFINDLLPTQTSLPSSDFAPLEKHLNDLLTRLSLLSQDTSSALEQSIHDVSRNVPRLTYDLQFMRESAISLGSSLQSVQARMSRQTTLETDANTDESRTQRALEKLSHLDKLKTRMESARDILREAESWSTLEGEIISLIASQSWDKAGERLAEASRSMVVFQNTPGEYETRRDLLVSLQNDLEIALSAALRQAISKNDIEACARFYGNFEMMGRDAEFRSCYFSARRTGVVDEWNSVILLDTTLETFHGEQEMGIPTRFTTFLPRFYASLLSMIAAERATIPLIFPPSAALKILSTLLQTTLDGLSPSMQSRLEAVTDHYGAGAVTELSRAFKATEELALGVAGIFEKMKSDTQSSQLSGSALSTSPSAASPIQSEPKTPRSKRQSASRRLSRAHSSVVESGPPLGVIDWEPTLFEPFLDLQSSYPSLERRYLSYLLKHDAQLISSSGTRPEKILCDRAVAVFDMADDAIARCMAFTHGYGATGLVDALDGFVESFLMSHQDSMLALAKRSSSNKSTAPDELDFEGLDYSTEEWGTFQIGLHILEACRDVREKLRLFEERLYLALSRISTTSTDRTHTTSGAITLLQQSLLNSTELNSLVSSLRSPSHPLLLAREALTSFTRASQRFLQDIILSPLRTQLDAYPSLSVWSQPEKPQRRGELQIPSFSLSPTDNIARVSEGLLNLLRVFEVYAADDALSFSLGTLPFVDAESLVDITLPARSKMNAETTARGNGSSILTAESVLSTWISSLSLSLIFQLTRTVLPNIRALSSPGAAQLSSDLGYLSNAVRALDVEWDELERWREAVGCDEEKWRGRIKEVEEGDDIWKRVGMMRGWIT